MRVLAPSLLILACACLPALAQEIPKGTPPRPSRPEARAPLQPTRPRLSANIVVGEKPPNFELHTSRGRDLALSSLRGEWVLLRFARDRRELRPLRSIQQDLAALEVTLIGLCRDNPQGLRSFARREAFPFEIMADPTGEISALYGLYDHTTSSSRNGCIVLDREGIVRLILQGETEPATLVELARYAINERRARTR